MPGHDKSQWSMRPLHDAVVSTGFVMLRYPDTRDNIVTDDTLKALFGQGT